MKKRRFVEEVKDATQLEIPGIFRPWRLSSDAAMHLMVSRSRGAHCTYGAARHRQILLVVAELHRRGFQRVRIVPSLGAEGCYWQCKIVPAAAMASDDGNVLIDENFPTAAYPGDFDSEYYWWDGILEQSPDLITDQFVERFPGLMSWGTGRDWAYAGWYQEMMRATQPDAVPLIVDSFDGFSKCLVAVGGRTIEELMSPPPGTGARSRR